MHSSAVKLRVVRRCGTPRLHVGLQRCNARHGTASCSADIHDSELSTPICPGLEWNTAQGWFRCQKPRRTGTQRRAKRNSSHNLPWAAAASAGGSALRNCQPGGPPEASPGCVTTSNRNVRSRDGGGRKFDESRADNNHSIPSRQGWRNQVVGETTPRGCAANRETQANRLLDILVGLLRLPPATLALALLLGSHGGVRV